MPKYINADDMLADECEAYLSAQAKTTDKLTRDINYVVHTKLQRLLADAPTVDAVEVVRCKDCKWYSDDYCCQFGDDYGDDWYCADGERREEDAKQSESDP